MSLPVLARSRPAPADVARHRAALPVRPAQVLAVGRLVRGRMLQTGNDDEVDAFTYRRVEMTVVGPESGRPVTAAVLYRELPGGGLSAPAFDVNGTFQPDPTSMLAYHRSLHA